MEFFLGGGKLWLWVANLDELTVLEACYTGNDPSFIIIYENFMEMNAVIYIMMETFHWMTGFNLSLISNDWNIHFHDIFQICTDFLTNYKNF